MNTSHASQKDGKPPCKSGKRCQKRSREHLDMYKHSQNKDYVKVDNRSPKTRDLAEKVNLKTSGELPSVNRREDSVEENQSGHDRYPVYSEKDRHLFKPESNFAKKNEGVCNLGTFKHKIKKAKVTSETKTLSGKRDLTGNVKLKNSSDVSMYNVDHKRDSEGEIPSSHDKYLFCSGQKDSTTSLNEPVRKYAKKNEEHLDKSKHKPNKDDVKVDNKKRSGKMDLTGNVKLKNSSDVSMFNVDHRRDSEGEIPSSHDKYLLCSGQKNSRTPLNEPVRKYGKKNEETLDKSKLKAKKDDVKVDNKKISGKMDLTGYVKLKTSSDVAMLFNYQRRDSDDEIPSSLDEMDQSDAGHKNERKCSKQNKVNLDKYKHTPSKDDVKVVRKKTSRKNDSTNNVKLKNSSDVSMFNVDHRRDSKGEIPSSRDKYLLCSGQKNSRTPLNEPVRKYGKKNEETLDKSKLKAKKDDVKVDNKKISGKMDLTGYVKLKTSSDVAMLFNYQRRDSDDEIPSSLDEMDQSDAGHKNERKCSKQNKVNLDKYKHTPSKDDVKVVRKKTSRKNDSTNNVKLKNSSDVSMFNVDHRRDSKGEIPSSRDKYLLCSGQKNSRTPLNEPVRKYGKKNEETLDKSKLKAKKDDVKVDNKKISGKMDLTGYVKLKTSSDVAMLFNYQRRDSDDEIPSSLDEMDQSDTGQKNERKCSKQNKVNLDKYKHTQSKDDVKVVRKKTSRKNDSTNKVKLKNSSDVSMFNVDHRRDSKGEIPSSRDKYLLCSGQKDSRTPLNEPVRKYGKKNEQTMDKSKLKAKKDDVKVDNKKISRNRDSTGKVKLNDSIDESFGVDHRKYSVEGCSCSHETNDKELSSNAVANETVGSILLHSRKQQTNSTMDFIAENTKQQEHCSTTNYLSDDSDSIDEVAALFIPKIIPGEKFCESNLPEISDDSSDDDNDGLSEIDWLSNSEVYEWNQQISKLFNCGKMPGEFFDFWAFCKNQNPSQPEDILLPFGLKLVGPFDVLAGHMNACNPAHLEKGVLHWRYFYDPPEFQTIIASIHSQFHIGYFRDNPLDCPIAIVSNDPEENCIIKMAGRSLFAILRKYLNDFDGKPAKKFYKKMIRFESRGVSYILEGRKNISVVNTFNTFGISISFDLKVYHSYRPLPVSNELLQYILKCYYEANVRNDKNDKAIELQTVINYAVKACNENNFGTQLELGIDVFCDGNPRLHSVCKSLLCEVYQLVKKPQFAAIIKMHLAHRRKGLNMSIL